MKNCDNCRYKLFSNRPCDYCMFNDQWQPIRRYDTFRQQTETIDGLVEWTKQFNTCRFCDYVGDSCSDKDCKQGIKAYWEGVSE